LPIGVRAADRITVLGTFYGLQWSLSGAVVQAT
jgi:hypothetical protein